MDSDELKRRLDAYLSKLPYPTISPDMRKKIRKVVPYEDFENWASAQGEKLPEGVVKAIVGGAGVVAFPGSLLGLLYIPTPFNAIAVIAAIGGGVTAVAFSKALQTKGNDADQ